MVRFSLLRKIIPLAVIFLLFFSGCTPSSAPRWTYYEYPNHFHQFHTKISSYTPCGPCKGLELELVENDNEQRLYINLMILPVNPKGGKTVRFAYFIGQDEYQGFATAMVGGQRLLVQPGDRNTILEALYQGESVRIKLGMYDQEIEPLFSKMGY